jgi:hypothetical protein
MQWRHFGIGRAAFAAHICSSSVIMISLVIITACSGDVTDPAPSARVITLDVTSLSMIAGDRREVTINVAAEGPPVSLAVDGLPGGSTANFSPQILPTGLTRSVMTLAAGTPAEAILTIRAISLEAQPGSPQQSTATLRVSVTNCPGYAIPEMCPPFPTGGDLSITGVVMERTAEGTRPREGHQVWAWVQRATNGYASASVRTGQGGLFFYPTFPPSLVVIQLWNSEWDHPCASVVQLESSSVIVNGEVVASARPIYNAAPTAPAFFGVVYEQTTEGRRPVAGARVFFETLFEIIAATTTTDEQGRYSLCSLPTMTPFITPHKPGYVLTPRAVTVSGVKELDLELVKQ